MYPYDCKVTGIDYSPLALEIALTKATSNEIEYKLEDVEK